jgi:hypothetical protein
MTSKDGNFIHGFWYLRISSPFGHGYGGPIMSTDFMGCVVGMTTLVCQRQQGCRLASQGSALRPASRASSARRAGCASSRLRSSPLAAQAGNNHATTNRRCKVYGDPGLPPGIPIMHTIHDPRKTVVNPHNRVGISDYIIHYITSLKVLHRPLGRI